MLKRLLFFFLILQTALFAREVALVALHPAPAEHFLAYAKVLRENGHSVRFFAGEEAWKKIDGAGELCGNFDQLIPCQLSPDCLIILDIHLPALYEEKVRKFKRLLYYDNFEPYVPGGYSELLALRLQTQFDGLLFASRKLAHEPIYGAPGKEIAKDIPCYGIGFYPGVEEIAPASQKKKGLLLYLGAANPLFFDKGLPFFIDLLLRKPHGGEWTLLYQPHPRAAYYNSPDLHMLEAAREALKKRSIELVISTGTPDEAMAEAMAVFYFQTSMIPRALLRDLALYQVAEEANEDFAIRSGFASWIDSSDSLQAAIEKKCERVDRAAVMSAIGYDAAWDENFLTIIRAI